MTHKNPSQTPQQLDCLIIGAGAAGLMCAIEAAKRGRKTLIIEHANKPGKKILMSGGGRCNFTNLYISADKYQSHNPHFVKSALSRYTQWDFIELVQKHNIAYHEKTLGQLFCDHKAKDIVNMLLTECDKYQARLNLQESVKHIQKNDKGFHIATDKQSYQCASLVIATGGLSIPTLGASAFGYEIAKQFNIPVYPTRAGLVPFTLHDQDKNKFSTLSGISVKTTISCKKQTFTEDMLFTHRGLSGPAILQISSYWQPSDKISINFIPNGLPNFEKGSNKALKTWLNTLFSKRLTDVILPQALLERKLSSFSESEMSTLQAKLANYEILPNNTEGYRTAEVTLGGVDTNAISSKTMESKHVQGLYFIGEVLDITGWLGGYNFQWAWSSGWAAGQYV